MASGSIEIRAPQDLLQALVKARKVEEAFEEVVHWQGFLTVKDTEMGKLLGRLVRESATHERLVDSLIRMIEPSASAYQEARIAPIVVDGDDEMQFLQKLMEGEDLAYYVYSLILSELDHLDLKRVVGERNAMEFRRVLSKLVLAERTHRELVSELLAARRPP
jgi:rubrerythrin